MKGTSCGIVFEVRFRETNVCHFFLFEMVYSYCEILGRITCKENRRLEQSVM